MSLACPHVLTIAGSDSGGASGIQADLRTFAALGVRGMAAITVVTAQDSKRVLARLELPPDLVGRQIDAVASDQALGADAAKTGMLGSGPIVEAVAAGVMRHRIGPLVVDPVMVSTGGDRLLAPEAVPALISKLFPLAAIVTPNLAEAGALVGRRLDGVDAMHAAARDILAMGPRAVVIKGGHAADPNRSLDFFFDGSRAETLAAPRILGVVLRGAGCVFSAALAAFLARGLEPLEAVARAKEHVTEAIRRGERQAGRESGNRPFTGQGAGSGPPAAPHGPSDSGFPHPGSTPPPNRRGE